MKLNDSVSNVLLQDVLKATHDFLGGFEYTCVPIALTQDRVIVRCNFAFAALFGYTPQDLMGYSGRVLYRDMAAFAQMGEDYRGLLATGQAFRAEREFIHRDGHALTCVVSVSAIKPMQPHWGVIWLFNDVTQEREEQARLQCLLEEAQAILNNAALGFVVLKNRIVERCNPRLEAMFGYPEGSMQGVSTRAWHIDELAFKHIEKLVYPQLAQGGRATHELPFRRADGSLFWVRMSGRLLDPTGGPITGSSLWILDDISEKRKTEEALLAATRLNQIVFESAGAAIIATDTQGVIQLFNAAAERLLGYSAQEMINQQTPALLHDETEVVQYAHELTLELHYPIEPGFDVFCIKARLQGRDEREWTYISKTGQRIPVMLCVTALVDSLSEITGYLGIAQNFTEQRKAQQILTQSQIELEAQVQLRTVELARANQLLQLEIAERIKIEHQMRQMAHYDPVTDLPNRNLLRESMARILLEGQRNHEPVVVMFLDLDRFKNINDTFGHIVGDALLRQVAQRLSNLLRVSDTLARIGGDEFVLILSSQPLGQPLELLAKTLIAALDEPIAVQERMLHVTTSIGICVFPQDGTDSDMLLRNADTAMYQAKAAGRNTFRFFTESMNRETSQRYHMESSLRVGVRNDELRLQFQPLIDMQSNRIFGVEALVRWQSPSLGLVPPAQFISVAEETDLIVEIDSWVMRQACLQGMRWADDGIFLKLAVNLSARQFRRKDLVAFVAEVLNETGFPAQYLELEITESSLMHNLTEVIQTLDALVALGVRLSIDDFGTGYSSLAYLKRFPVHKLKIDQSFVRDLGQTNSDLAIVKTIITLAHTLKLDLLAEGVETPAHLATLRALDCQHFQGYLFSKPVWAEQITQMLACSATALQRLQTTMA